MTTIVQYNRLNHFTAGTPWPAVNRWLDAAYSAATTAAERDDVRKKVLDFAETRNPSAKAALVQLGLEHLDTYPFFVLANRLTISKLQYVFSYLLCCRRCFRLPLSELSEKARRELAKAAEEEALQPERPALPLARAAQRRTGTQVLRQQPSPAVIPLQLLDSDVGAGFGPDSDSSLGAEQLARWAEGSYTGAGCGAGAGSEIPAVISPSAAGRGESTRPQPAVISPLAVDRGEARPQRAVRSLSDVELNFVDGGDSDLDTGAGAGPASDSDSDSLSGARQSDLAWPALFSETTRVTRQPAQSAQFPNGRNDTNEPLESEGVSEVKGGPWI